MEEPDKNENSVPEPRIRRRDSFSSSSGASAASKRGQNEEDTQRHRRDGVRAARSREVLDKVVQSGNRSEHVAKLKSLFLGLFRSATDNGINEPLDGLLIQSILDLAAETVSLRHALDTPMVVAHLVD